MTATWLRDRKVKIVGQFGLKREPELPDVPLLQELAKDEDARRIIELFSTQLALGRPLYATAGATCSLTMHGRGAGDDGPIITDHARDPEQLAVALQENMAFVFKPSAETASGMPRSICTWGDTIVVSPSGGRRLGKRPHDLAVSGR